MKSKSDWVRRAQCVIRMVSELHRMRYQWLRIMPYKHPNAWRLALAPYESFSEHNSAIIPLESDWQGIPVYSSAAGNNYFDWADAKADDARALAEKFVVRFPEIARRGQGRDWCYAGWLCELLGVLEGGDWLPVAYWEYMKGAPEDLEFLPIWSASGNNLDWEGNEAIPGPNARPFPLPPVTFMEEPFILSTSQPSENIMVLQLGAEGGDFRLVLHMTEKGIYSFRVESDSSESAFFDKEDFPELPYTAATGPIEAPLIIDWAGALRLLDEYRSSWPLFCPIYIHPNISVHILNALKEQYSKHPEIDFGAWDSHARLK